MDLTLPFQPEPSGASSPVKTNEDTAFGPQMGEFVNACRRAGIPRSLIGNSDRTRLVSGQGSSWKVYQARIERPPGVTSCAVKMLRGTPLDQHYSNYPEATTFRKKQLEAAANEAKVLCHQPFREHENILKMLEWGWNTHGRDDDDEDPSWQLTQPFLVVEYTPKKTLAAYLLDHPSVSSDLARELGIDVAAGLEALHGCGVTHGDIKSENVLIFVHDKRELVAKISDFSHCVIGPDGGFYLGTELVHPPEIRNRGVSVQLTHADLVACDAWGLGVVLYQLMGGQFFNSAGANLKDVDEIWNDDGLNAGMSLLNDEMFTIWGTVLHSLLQEHSESRESAGYIRKVLDTDGRVQAPKLEPIEDRILTVLDVQSLTPAFDEKFIFQRLFVHKGISGPDKTRSKYLFQVAQGHTIGFGAPPSFGQFQHSMIFALAGGASSSDSQPPDPVVLGACNRIMTAAPLDRLQRQENSQMTDSIIACEIALSSVPSTQYFSERIRMYRAASVAILATAALHLDPPMLAVEDTASLLYHVDENLIGFSSRVFVDEPIADMDLNDGIPLAHFLGLLGATSSLEKVISSEESGNPGQMRDDQGNTILHYACMGGHADLVLRLCQVHGLDGFAPNLSGTLPLHWLVMFTPTEMETVFNALAGRIDGIVAQQLAAISSGVSLPVHFAWLRGSPLHWAVSCGNKAAVELLVRFLVRVGGDLNLEHDSYTALALSTELHLVEIVELLLVFGAKHSGIGPFRRSALHFMAGNAPVIKKRIVHGKGYRQSIKRTLEKLIYHGCDIESRDKFGNTPLLKTVASPFERGQEDDLIVLQEMLLHGANRNAQNEDGDSALHILVLRSWSDKPNHTVAFKMLLDDSFALGDEDIDVTLRDRHGRSPNLLAAYFQMGDLSQLLNKIMLRSREVTLKEIFARDNYGDGFLELTEKGLKELLDFEVKEAIRLRDIGLGVDNIRDCS